MEELREQEAVLVALLAKIREVRALRETLESDELWEVFVASYPQNIEASRIADAKLAESTKAFEISLSSFNGVANLYREQLNLFRADRGEKITKQDLEPNLN